MEKWDFPKICLVQHLKINIIQQLKNLKKENLHESEKSTKFKTNSK